MNVLDDAIHAERAVVGSCIYNPHEIRATAKLVHPDDFADVRLGELYGLIAGMVTAGGPTAVTPLTVFAEVNRRRADPAARTLLPDSGELGALATHGIPGSVEAHARLIRAASVSRALATYGRRITQSAESGMDPALLAAKAVEDAKSIRDGWRAGTVLARSLAEVLAEEDGAYDWLIPGLLERKDRLIVTGAEGAGKSTLVRQIAVCAAGGLHPFTGELIPPKRVLVVDCENSERQWRRATRGIANAVWAAIGRTLHPAEAVQLACMARMDITTAADLGAIHGLIDEHEPDLVIVGPLYRLVPRAITNDDDAAPVLAALDSIRDRGVTLMMEAHAGHALGRGGERDYRPRGSSALMGWPEFGFGLAPDADVPSLVKVIRWRGDRDERNWPLSMRRGGTLPWTDERHEPPTRNFGLRAAD